MTEVLLDMQSKIARNPDYVAVPMDGDLVIMSIDKGTYFGINSVGARIWESLESSLSLQDLSELLMADFEVNTEQCAHELQQFVRQLLDANIVMLA